MAGPPRLRLLQGGKSRRNQVRLQQVAKPGALLLRGGEKVSPSPRELPIENTKIALAKAFLERMTNRPRLSVLRVRLKRFIRSSIHGSQDENRNWGYTIKVLYPDLLRGIKDGTIKDEHIEMILADKKRIEGKS